MADKVEKAPEVRRSARVPKPIQRLKSSELIETRTAAKARIGAGPKKAAPEKKRAKKEKKEEDKKKKDEKDKDAATDEEDDDEKDADTTEDEGDDEEKKKAKGKGKGKRGRPKKAEELKPTKKVLDELTAAQRECLEKMSVEELKERLTANDCLKGGPKGDLVLRVAYNVVHGVPGRCPTCFGGKIKRSVDGGFFCPGAYDDDKFVACSFKADSVVCVPWKPKEGQPI